MVKIMTKSPKNELIVKSNSIKIKLIFFIKWRLKLDELYLSRELSSYPQVFFHLALSLGSPLNPSPLHSCGRLTISSVTGCQIPRRAGYSRHGRAATGTLRLVTTFFSISLITLAHALKKMEEHLASFPNSIFFGGGGGGFPP